MAEKKNSYTGLKATLDITSTVAMWLGAAALADQVAPLTSKGFILNDKRQEAQILFFSGAGLTVVAAASKALIK